MGSFSLRRGVLSGLLAIWATAGVVIADDILQTTGFSTCINGTADVSVQKVDISYNAGNKTVTFDVLGTSNKIQNVTAILNVTAYGQHIYSNSFDPCAANTYVQQLCPVPAGTFGAKGVQAIPAQYASMVPSIAFQIPDIAAMATLQLKSADTGEDVACIQSQVTNGKTANVPAISYVAATVAGAALVVTGVGAASAAFVGGGASAAAGGSVGGAGTPSPGFIEVFTWFQGLAMNGMMSVNYPQVYRSFSKNFGFSAGLIPWAPLQTAIDNFRRSTGGNLTDDNVQFLKNATLVFPDGSTSASMNGTLRMKRAMEHFAFIASRQIQTTVNETAPGNTTDPNSTTQSIRVAVKGIQAYVEELSIPSANTFMTVLLIVAIVIATIAVGILLVKVILEVWALFGNFPESLAGFRKHYWGSIARAITNLILLLYGVWVLYCIFQFTNGDSWAAKALAGVTLAIFTGILGFFSYKIWSTARKLKQSDGDVVGLYEDKSIWVKYSLFYESYKKSYWWIFLPTIIYMFVKGCVLAAADGHGMIQTIAQLIVEAVMLVLLLWSRPYERRSGNVINITIQVVRVLSVVCILVFVEEFGIAQTTQTVTGVVLIAVQAALTGVLAILIIWNALIACCKQNPHRKRRKEMEKIQRDMDTLTPLDARNSLLKHARAKSDSPSETSSTFSIAKTGVPQISTTPAPGLAPNRYMGNTDPERQYSSRTAAPPTLRPLTPTTPLGLDPSRENLMRNAAPIGSSNARQPTLPSLGGGLMNSRPGYTNNAGYRPPPAQNSYGPGRYGPSSYGGGGYNNGYNGQYRGPPSRGGF